MSIGAVWSKKLKGYKSDADGHNQLRIARLTLLIGPNNSGKSRLLRTIFSSGNSDLYISLGEELIEGFERCKGFLDFLKSNPKITNFESWPFINMVRGELMLVDSVHAQMTLFTKFMTEVYNENLVVTGGQGATAFHSLRRLLSSDHSLKSEVSDSSAKLSQKVAEITSSKRYYIPILRGMRPLSDADDVFLERTIKDYFPDKLPHGLSIVTGFDLYQLLVKFLLGQPADRQRVRDYEKIIGHEFFGGAEITLIPEYGKDTVSVKIGEDDQFSIYDLGDGMQQVIIITSAAFLETGSAKFFIEEPEACLHPGLLRKLALFLLNHTEHQYFATTHSNHLLDLAEVDRRVLIYKVAKANARKDAQFEVQECTRDRALLAELGVLASSVYLSNSTIWVEGITDRLYLGVFLKKYITDLESTEDKIKLEGLLENYHYTFVEYQGGTLGHWSFDEGEDQRLQASRLCASAFLISDGDIAGKGGRAQELVKQLGARFYIMGCKEIENLIPRNIIILTARSIFSRKWSKTTQGLSIEDLSTLATKIEHSNKGIGFHLDKSLGLPGKGKAVRRVFADESGTINDKVKFCLAAIDQMDSNEWSLTPQLKELCEKIFNHILTENKR
ncbi:AAA family ATPase [Pseudomonas sp. 2835]|uniref:AAA family ATPase n=1 Tax=Pseudomonas sp. 2835 TaxID=3156451 RepID=UPI003D1C9A4E